MPPSPLKPLLSPESAAWVSDGCLVGSVVSKNHSLSVQFSVPHRPLLLQEEFALCLAARIDELYLCEQELLWDKEVCEVGFDAATEIATGAEVGRVVNRTKWAAWQLEVAAVESLSVRFKARTGQTMHTSYEDLVVDIRRRREHLTNKLVAQLDLIAQYSKDESRVVKEAQKLATHLSSKQDHLLKEYDKIAQDKLDLTEIFYQLQNAIRHLLNWRQRTLVPTLRKMQRDLRMRTVSLSAFKSLGTAGAIAAVPLLILLPPVGTAVVLTALGVQASSTATDFGFTQYWLKQLVTTLSEDHEWCSKVEEASKDMASRMAELDPHGDRLKSLLSPSRSRCEDVADASVNVSREAKGATAIGIVGGSGAAALSATAASCAVASNICAGVIGFGAVISALDLASSWKVGKTNQRFVKHCLKEVEGENERLRALTAMINSRCGLRHSPMDKAPIPSRSTRSE